MIKILRLACLVVHLLMLKAYLFTNWQLTKKQPMKTSPSGKGAQIYSQVVMKLMAKKQKQMFSSDFLSAIDGEEEDESELASIKSAMSKKKPSLPPKATDAKPISFKIESAEESNNNDKGKKGGKEKKKKGDQRHFQNEISDAEELQADTDDVESIFSLQAATDSSAQKTKSTIPKKEKSQQSRLSSKIRITERTQPSFVMMGLQNVELLFGDEAIVKNASFSVATGERVGLVGPNGGGKSTQLRILAGSLIPNRGDVVKTPSNLRVAFLRQEFIDELQLTRTLKEELLSACVEEQAVLAAIQACEQEIEQSVDDPDKMETAINRLQDLQDQAVALGAYNLDSKIQKIMDSMGFSPDEEDHLVGSFSGGWKMRIGLAKILCSDPNILLLDEPTNHMDFESVLWLEDFLKRQSLPMIIVSHDREFLDQVCNKIVDVEDGTTISYQGNYSKFLQQRRERLATWRDRYEKQQKYVAEEEKWIRKAKNDPVLQPQVKQREAQLEKYQKSLDYLAPPPKDRKFRFRFPPAPRCGDMLLDAQGLQHGFGTGKYQVLFKDVDFEVRKGNRIGFIGPNGSGKSTMLKILMGLEKPQKGYAEVCSDSVQINYYAQNQADQLNLEHTVLDAVQEVAPPEVTMVEIRGLLGQFLFKGDDVFKKIRMLSGGEKARVALCRLMLTPANLLLLDEPTNHLDITSKEVLEDALLNYAGSVLIVSHDRYFLSQVVNTIFEFGNQTVKRYDCDYHDYLELISQRDEPEEEEESAEQEESWQQGESLPLFPTSDELPAEARSVRKLLGFSLGENNTAFSTASSSLAASPLSKESMESEEVESKKNVKKSASNQPPTLKDRMTARYVEGDKYRITKAKEVVIEEKNERSKNFGGSGVTCGNLNKGIKNAKRYTS